MAGRSVGSIEVTVDANTGKMRATLVKDATSAGREAKNALERELQHIEAELELNSAKARAELRKFQEASERLGIEMELGLSDESKAKLKAELAALDEQLDDLEAIVGVKLDPAQKKLLEEQIRNIEEGENTVKLLLKPDDDRLRVALAAYEKQKYPLQMQLEADTAALQARLDELASKRHDIQFALDIDDKSRAIMEAQLGRIQVEDRTIELTARLDEKRVLAQLRDIQNADIKLGLDAAEATAEFETWKQRIQHDRLEAQVTGDFTDFNLGVKELRAHLALMEFEVKVDADIADTIAKMELLQAEIKKNPLNFKTEADMAKARATILAFRELQQSNDIEIPVSLDVNEMEAQLAKIEARMESLGDGGGGGGGGGMRRKTKVLLASVTELGDEIAGVLQGGLSVATQGLSSAFSALAGSGGALVSVFAALGGGVTTLIIGFQGMGDAVKMVNSQMTAALAGGAAFNANSKEIQEAMKGLAPAAKEVVLAFASFAPQLQAIKGITQQNLFSGIGDALRDLSKQLPALSTGFGGMATSINTTFKGIIETISGMDIKGIFAGLTPVLDNLGEAVVNALGAVEPFLKAAAPAAQLMTDALAGAAASLAEMVKAGQKSGKLTEFLMDGVKSLGDWLGLLGQVGKLLFTVFQAGKEGGDGFIRSLSNIVGQWNDWLNSLEGQKALDSFFESGKQLLSDLVPLIHGVAEAFDVMISPRTAASFSQLIADIGELLPFLAEMMGLVSRVGITNVLADLLVSISQAITPILPQLQELASALGSSLAGAVSAVSPVLGIVAEALGFLAEALTPLAPMIVAVATAWYAWKGISTAFAAVKTAIDGIGVAMKGLETSSLVMIGISAAVGIAMYAMQSFGAEQKTVNARSKEVADTLETEVNQLLQTATSSTAAALGVTALSKALADAGGDGERFTKALGVLGKTADDTLTTLQSFGNKNKANTTAALMELGKSADLTSEQLKKMVDIVVMSDDPVDTYGEAWRNLAEETGRSQAEIERLVGALEEVNDQAENTDIQQLTRDWIASSGAANDLNASLLVQAENFTGVKRNADDVSLLYADYTKRLGENAAQANASEAATKALATAQANAVGSITDADKATLKAAEDLQKLQAALGDVDITALHGQASGAAKAYDALARSFDKNAKAAEEMSKAFDILIGGHLNFDEAVSAVQQGLDDLNTVLKDQEPLAKQTAAGFDLTTESGRTLAEQIRSGITDITNWGQAALASGTSAEDTAAMMAAMKTALVDQAAQYFTTRAEAEAYINQLGLTPENIQTLVSTPGLIEAMTNITGYDHDMDGIPDSLDTTVDAINIDQVREKLQGMGVDVTSIPDDVLLSFFTENAETAQKQVDDFNAAAVGAKSSVETTVSAPGADAAATAIGGVNDIVGVLPDSAPVTVSAPGAVEAEGDVSDLNTAVGKVKATVATTFNTPGLQEAIDQVNKLKAAEDLLYNKSIAVTVTGAVEGKTAVDNLRESIRQLSDKTVTVRTNNVTSTTNGMTGSLITGPRNMNVGERGYAEALVPLQLPLNRVDPAVRDMAELLRGGGPSRSSAPGGGKIVNNYMTITPQSADPGAVATQVINRSVVMANR